MKSIVLIVAIFFTTSLPAISQNSVDLSRPWPARWISHPTASPTAYGVYHFRRSFGLEHIPKEFVIHISADNRYRLFVNGNPVGLGPARGDLQHWRYETYDLAPYLVRGKNTLAVLVWNFASMRPYAQFSDETGLIVQGDDDSQVVNTNDEWKVIQNHAYKPETTSAGTLRSFTVVGPGDIVDGSKYPWGWQEPGFSDQNWAQAKVGRMGYPYGTGTDARRMLVPREIPFMEEFLERMGEVRIANINVAPSFLEGKDPLTIPANSVVTLLIDNQKLTTAYPELVLSGGKRSEIKVTYAEALFDKNRVKGNRDIVEGKKIIGYEDYFYPDGGANRLFRTLWLRTYRYIQLDITTGEEPLVLKDYYGMFTGYPFEKIAAFSSDDQELEQIWETAWRTTRLCAGETHYDCPYYEQLSYIGDTRIQCLITLYVSGDDRLMRKSIKDFYDSSIPEGLTQSRYPSYVQQVIPTYSLFWIAMIHDYWMLRDDELFVRSFLDAIESILGWYEKYLQPNGLLAEMPWWHFTDWAEEWRWNPETRIGGVPNGSKTENSSIQALQYAYALEHASDLLGYFGRTEKADHYSATAKKVKEGVIANCWNAERGLISESPSMKNYSQHSNIFGILTDAIPKNEQAAVLERVLNEEDLIQATFYFKFYLFRAMAKTGAGDSYIDQLDPWKDMLANGLTTFAERPDPTRSDCHAWSASPMYDLLSTVSGINPGSPGFKTVQIKPHPGQLDEITAEMPHPEGTISLHLRNSSRKLKGLVTIPNGVRGNFEFQGKEVKLESGENQIEIRK